MSLLIGFLDKLCFRLILTSANLCWIIACSLSKLLCECVWKAFAALDNCCFHFSYVLQFFWNKQIFKINLKLFVRAGEGWPAPTNPLTRPKNGQGSIYRRNWRIGETATAEEKAHATGDEQMMAVPTRAGCDVGRGRSFRAHHHLRSEMSMSGTRKLQN